jgi:DNA-binding response OmpR family regulator
MVARSAAKPIVLYSFVMDSAESTILVVDDDPGLRELLRDYLGSNGFAVQEAGDGAGMKRQLARSRPDLIILDLMLPGEDGLTLARWLRGQGDTPVIMLSARGEEIDRVVGLEVGADDYLPKPFSPRELLARIRAVLRRRGGPSADSGGEDGAVHSFGPYRLDAAAHRLTRDGGEVAVTGAEFALLRVFVEHPNRVLSRDTLMDLLKGYDRAPFDRSIDVRITRLRRKIEDDPATPVYIRTVRGEGYLFSPKGSGA